MHRSTYVLTPRVATVRLCNIYRCLKPHRRGSKVFRSEKHMFLFDPKLDEIYVGNIIKTYVSSNICFRFDPTLPERVSKPFKLKGFLRKGMPYQTFSRKGMPKLFYHKKGCQWSSFSRKGMPKGPLASDWPIISQVVRIINDTSYPALNSQ